MANTRPFKTDRVRDIAQAIYAAFRAHQGPGAFIAAVGGGAASGKSYLTETLYESFSEAFPGQVALLRLDNFLGDGLGLEMGPNWEGYDWVSFKNAVLGVRQGRNVRVPIKDWESSAIRGLQLLPSGLRILLIDGVGIFQDELDELYHIGFWVDCPEEERLRRGIARSYATPRTGGGNYGDAHLPMWPVWMEKDRKYMKRHAPSRRPIVAGILQNGQRLPMEAIQPR